MGLQTNKSSSHASSFNSVHSPFKLHCGVANLYAFNVVYIFGKTYFLEKICCHSFQLKKKPVLASVVIFQYYFLDYKINHIQNNIFLWFNVT